MRAKTATGLTSLFCFAILLSAVSNVGHCQNSWGSSGGYSSSGGRVVYVTSHHATPVRNLLARAHQRVHGHLHSTGSVGSWGSSGGSSGGASWGSSGGSSGGASWGSSGGASWGSSGGQVVGAPGYGALPTTQVPTPPKEQDEEVAQDEEATEEEATEDEQSSEAEYKDKEEDGRSFDEEADEVDEAHEESTNSTRDTRTLVANQPGTRAKSDVDELGLSSDFYLKAAKVHRALEQKRVADSDSESNSEEIKKTVARK